MKLSRVAPPKESYEQRMSQRIEQDTNDLIALIDGLSLSNTWKLNQIKEISHRLKEKAVELSNQKP